NELILNNIFIHLDQKSLDQCLSVCRQWHYLAKSVDRSKRKIFQIISVFLIDRFNSLYIERSRTLSLANPIGSIVDFDTRSIIKGPEIFEYQFLFTLKRSYSQPKCLILFEGNNVKIGKKRRWKRAKVINTIRSSLPHDCAVIGIDAHYGIIGEDSESTLSRYKDPMTISYDLCGLFGISCFMLPKYEGVTITIFERATDELEEDFNFPDDVKAVILFSSGVGHHGNYLAHSQVDAIFDHFQGQLALGGAQVNDKLVTRQPTVLYYSDDTANFYFINGPPPYNSMFNPKKMSLIGIQFSGSNCSAASLSIDSLVSNDYNDGDLIMKELAHIEATLIEFRSNLTFACDTIGSCNESIAFLFFNFDSYRRYVNHTNDVNSGVSIFHKVFPKTHITGVLCHAQYQHNYTKNQMNQENLQQLDYQLKQMDINLNLTNQSLTKSDESKSTNTSLLPSPQGIASFVIINIQK
ncbi:uncharacterized protein LOC128392461, partial [Panonychus citri]|uniref:uncharacterized protein LOC128392461 n=1 Tax=Panonychus citri TaxID=50023 RepID=UPI002307664F